MLWWYFLKKMEKVIQKKAFLLEKIFKASESGLFWKYMPPQFLFVSNFLCFPIPTPYYLHLYLPCKQWGVFLESHLQDHQWITVFQIWFLKLFQISEGRNTPIQQIHIVMLAKPSIYCTIICLGLCVRDVLVSERDSHWPHGSAWEFSKSCWNK